MTNPLLDQRRYLWDREEAQHVHIALYQGVSKADDIDLLYKMVSADLPQLALEGRTPYAIWKDALENIAAHGLLRQLIALPRVQAMPAARDAADAMLAADIEIGARTVLHDGQIVLDRVRLDRLLSDLGPDLSPTKVILVRGAPESGKTHSRHRFERMARTWGADPVYLFDGLVATVDDVVKKLFAVLRTVDDVPPRGDSTMDAWFRDVCFKMQELAAARGRPLWIAVDDLGVAADGTPLLDQEIRRFFDQFALNLVDSSFSAWFRLMLIHYPEGPVPTKWEQDLWHEERTDEADVRQEHVADLIRSWSAARSRKVLEEEVLELAGQVIETAEARPPGNGCRLRHIKNALEATLRNLEGSRP
ncbi:hypothetical protein SK854_42210 [Lentzea sp. BCCO 10_0061]|uniref:Orc1-like AAA ATPase domain-containing protein n=1 Tax=Lentzea sokolovensis TaxID=3095429 RepID=A0ABU4VAH2_9PSEU|nr:hypothetical protein [Lentzea sp. BCCO 10_0061]MDX8148791.1 hypothetical protein [Lentzea sp. BCCO 10_0061]